MAKFFAHHNSNDHSYRTQDLHSPVMHVEIDTQRLGTASNKAGVAQLMLRHSAS